MNGSSYVAEDPWANGWANDTEPVSAVSRAYNSISDSPRLLLTTLAMDLTLPLALRRVLPLQLALTLPIPLARSLPLALPPPSHGIHDLIRDIGSLIGSDDPLNVPRSYHQLYAVALSILADSGLDGFFSHLESLTFSHTQRAQISDTVLLARWQDFSKKCNCLNMFALLALELELPGDGTLHVLSFRKKSLPELPLFIINAFAKEQNDTRDHPLAASTGVDGIPSSFTYEWDATDSHPSGPLSKPNHPDASKANPMDHHALKEYLVHLRNGLDPLVGSNDIIRIREVPEKEGLVFKHINYIITHELKINPNGPAGTKKVVRRYSDFSWLLEFLLKKYPFRIIPGLPPKKFSGASPDSQFLQRRRRGLHRFLNQLVKHPVLRNEPVVSTFMNVPTDLASWRRQARVDYSLEFAGQKISAKFLHEVRPAIIDQFEEMWLAAENAISPMIESWSKIVLLVERHEKRDQQIRGDNAKFGQMINKVKALNEKLYPCDQALINPVCDMNHDDMNAMNESLGAITDSFLATSQVLVDESITVNTIILEKFKNYLDYLYSFQELFERTRTLSSNTISQLISNVADLEKQYQKLSTSDADATGADLVKLRQSIINGKQEIFHQVNRDCLIKQCCLQEYAIFQATQYLIGEAWLDWCKTRMQCQQKLALLSESLVHDIENDLLMR